MRIKSKYIAEDGKSFEKRWKCEDYEDQIAQPRRSILKDYILFFNSLGKEMPYSYRRVPSYVFVKKFPNPDGQVFHIWNEVIPESLDSVLERFGETGWYIQIDDGLWKNLNDMRQEVASFEKSVAEIAKDNPQCDI